MALFNLLGGSIDIAGQGKRIGNSRLLDELGGGAYESKTFRYPIDLGSVDKGHYILININEQIYTNFKSEAIDINQPAVHENRQAVGDAGAVRAINAATRGVLSLGRALGTLPGVGPGLQGVAQATGLSSVVGYATGGINPDIGVRTIRRIKDTIALYMPNNLVFSDTQSYNTVSPGGTKMMAMLEGGTSFVDALMSETRSLKNITSAVFPYYWNYMLRKSEVGQILFAAGQGGQVINPMSEILYSTPNFRTFNFDFLFYPRDEQESSVVLKIIDLLRFHQAPELGDQNGYFLRPPSEFDIAFYYNGMPNPNIPKISTCVLEGITTNYAPNGFATYEVPGQRFAEKGGTGMPVGIALSLSFKETQFITKGSPLLNRDSKPGDLTKATPSQRLDANKSAAAALNYYRNQIN